MGRRQQSSQVKIGPADIQFVREHSAGALAYYASVGLAEVRMRSLRLLLTATIALLGLLWLGWSPLSMLCFLLADALICLLTDWVRWPLARRWINASHARDQQASKVLLIVDGLDDGTGKRIATGSGAASGGLLLFFGTVSAVFMVPLLGGMLEKIGLPSLISVIDDPMWLPLVLIDAVLTLGSGLLHALQIRRSQPGEKVMVIESGAVTLWLLGMMVLVWLPLTLGMSGLLLMLIILHGVRLAFGAFALYWMPRAVRRIALRQASGDYSVRAPAR